ncbi:MAG: oligosaccharide repeat unit polymerase [Acidobacteria bacterium]|nr:oligosaccharide repeat unit polymerase [Acidobacteriota bacterium]
MPELDNFWVWVVALLMVGLLVAYVGPDVRRLVRGRNVVLAGILAWFLLEGITLSPGLREFDQATYDYSVLCVFLSSAAFLAGYHLLTPTRLFDPVALRFRLLDDPEALWRLVLICSLIGFLPIAYYSGLQLIELINGMMGMRSTWGGLIGRARYGGFRDAMLMLENFVIGAGPLALILLLNRRVAVGRRLVCCLVVLWPLARAYGAGTRSSLIMAVLPAVAVIFFASNRRIQQAMVVAGLIAIPTVYTFMAAMLASRSSGQLSWEAAAQVEYMGSELLQELAYIVKNVPQNAEYQWGYNYYVQLVNPIPRYLWAGKPTLDTGILMAQLKGAVSSTGEPYLTISPGLIGEMYLNFGLYGIIGLSAFGGWLVRGWDRIIERHRDSLSTMVFYSMGLAVLFILGRSFTMNMFYGMMALYAGVWVTTEWVSAKGATSSAAPSQMMLGAGFAPGRTVP